MNWARRFGQACVLAVLWAGAGAARAEMVPISDTFAVQNTSMNVMGLTLGEGSYRVAASDLSEDWLGAPLATMDFAVSSSTELFDSMEGPGTLQFFMAAPGKAYVHLFTVGTGLVNLRVSAYVPLPASIALLGSALAVCLVLSRRRPVAAPGEEGELIGQGR